jgi:hypothetical protein
MCYKSLKTVIHQQRNMQNSGALHIHNTTTQIIFTGESVIICSIFIASSPTKLNTDTMVLAKTLIFV